MYVCTTMEQSNIKMELKLFTLEHEIQNKMGDRCTGRTLSTIR